MPVSMELLDILVCPVCKAQVTLRTVCPACKVSVKPTADNQGLECRRCGRVYPIKDGVSDIADSQGLQCGQCRRVYPIKDDIPVMLVDEAKIEPE